MQEEAASEVTKKQSIDLKNALEDLDLAQFVYFIYSLLLPSQWLWSQAYNDKIS